MKTTATASKESERLFSRRTVALPSPTKAWHTLSVAHPHSGRAEVGEHHDCGHQRPAAENRENISAITLSPRDYDAVLFDLYGVLTRTTSVHAAAWKRPFDGFLKKRSADIGDLFVPFDIDTDYRAMSTASRATMYRYRRLGEARGAARTAGRKGGN